MSNIPIELIRSNPFRSFDLNPIDEDQVAKLRASIDANDFWASVVARPTDDGHYELAFGHTRIEAARRLGRKTVPIEVRRLDDLQMARMLSDENGSQRDGSLAPCLDAVAAIASVVAYAVFRAEDSETLGTLPCQGLGLDYHTLRGQLDSGMGVGRACIQAVTQSFSRPQIRDALGILRDSGRMASIVTAARAKADAELEAERKAAEAALRQAETDAKAAQTAREQETAKAALRKAEAAHKKHAAPPKPRPKPKPARPVVFDDRCARLFNVNAHLNAFRRFVTGEVVRSYLPVNKQFEFAKGLLAEWEADQKREAWHIKPDLTSEWIIRRGWEMLQSATRIPKAKLRNNPERPILERLKEGFNLLRRARGDFRKGIAMIVEAIESGEEFTDKQAAAWEEHAALFAEGVRLVKEARKPPLRIVKG